MMGLASGTLEGAVELANEWIKTEKIQVINVETYIDVSGNSDKTKTI